MRNGILILLTYVAGLALIVLVSHSLVPADRQVEFLRNWNAYLVLGQIVILAGLLIWRMGVPTINRRILTFALLIAVVYAFSGFREPFEFKVLQDEAALSVAALSLNLNRINEVPYAGHQVGSVYELGSGYTDKRAVLFPLLLSIVHDIFGYRFNNAFFLNSIIYLILLTTVFQAARMLTNSERDESGIMPGAVATLIATATVPVMSRSAAGGGFELLNALFVVLLIIRCFCYVRKPDRVNLYIFLLVTVLLTHLRYESLIYVGFSTLIVLLTESNKEKRPPLGAILFFVALLIPAIFQLNLILSNSQWFELKAPGITPFGSENMYRNTGAALTYMFSTTREYSNNPVFYIFGGLCLIAVLVTLCRRKTFSESGERLVFLAWSTTVVAQFLVMLAYHAVELTDPDASRYVIPMTLLMALSVGMFYASARRFKIVNYSLVVVYCIGIFSFYLPTTARSAFKTNFYNYQTDWLIHVIEQQDVFHPLVITQEPWLLILRKMSATQISIINKRIDHLALHLRLGSYEEIYVLQNFTKDPRTGGVRYSTGSELNDRIKIEEVARLAIGPYTYSTISRVTDVADPSSQPESANRIEGNAVPKSRQDSTSKDARISPIAKEIWRRTLP